MSDKKLLALNLVLGILTCLVVVVLTLRAHDARLRALEAQPSYFIQQRPAVEGAFDVDDQAR